MCVIEGGGYANILSGGIRIIADMKKRLFRH